MADRFDPGRIEAFSDGVFAIAITLLVLEISVPADAFDDLWRGIVDEWASYLAYVTSFLTIGVLWLAHHALFRRTPHVDATVVRLNLLLLMVVAFMPFPTRLIADALDRSDAERAAVVFYGATVLVVSLLFAALTRHATTLVDEPARSELSQLTARLEPSLGFYGLILVLAIFAPAVAAFGFLAVAAFAILRT
jgi:uncharacterized membrane protein